MELNENALTTVERAVAAIKTYPFIPEGISFDDPDVIDEVVRLINSWSNYVQMETKTDFGVKQYVELYKGTNQPTLVIRHYPIKEIESIIQLTHGGEVVSTIDVEAMMTMMDADDLKNGMIYVEPMLASRHTAIGIVPEKNTSLRTYKIAYTAGYVLPKDETDETPSDVPPVLENLVIELVRSQFIASTDAIRASNLITLTEGNVQRMWSNPTEFKLTSIQERTLSMFKKKGL